MANLRLEAIEKTWPGGHVALRGVDLAVEDGERMVLVGPSGCGKSTALRLVAGLEAPSAGRVWIGDRDVTDASPRQRNVAMVFQSYALYPHKSVGQNLGFGLRMHGAAGPEIERRVAEVAARLGLSTVLERRPAELSGGQRQRVALGRALARCGGGEGPSALLLDEPLSNLDAKLRLEMRAELARLHRELGITLLYVTHDQEEALTLGDRIAVLADGRVEQVAPPLEVYRRPASRFVADFVGVPSINWFRGELIDEPGGVKFVCKSLRVAAPAGLAPGRAVSLAIRPQDLALAPPEEADLLGRVDVVEALGSALVVHARSPDGTGFRIVVPAQEKLRTGDPIRARLRTGSLHFFDAESGLRLCN
jgi:ABC-type sugar transport system ATPase subunit